MQKLLNTIDFSRNVRRNLFLLSQLNDVATDLPEVMQVNRRIKEYQNDIAKRIECKPGFIIWLELISIRQEIRALRRSVSKKTIEVLNKTIH